MKAMTLAELAAARIAAKRREDEAAQERREIDAQIACVLSTGSPEGTNSQRVGDYKVSVTFKVNRKVDAEALRSGWDHLSPAAQAAIKWKPELSTTEFRKLNDADVAGLAEFITTEPASPTIRIEAV